MKFIKLSMIIKGVINHCNKRYMEIPHHLSTSNR